MNTESPPTPLLIDRREAAHLLGVSVQVVVRLEVAGDLKRVDLGGVVRYTLASVHALIERGGSHPPSPKGRRGRPPLRKEGGE